MKDNYLIPKVLIVVILVPISVYWLIDAGEKVFKSRPLSIVYSSMCGLPVAFLIISFLLIYSCVCKQKSLKILSEKPIERKIIFRIFIDMISGTLLAFAIFISLGIFSPPFPFVGSLTCPTNWNDLTLLIPAGIFWWLRRLVRRNIKSD